MADNQKQSVDDDGVAIQSGRDTNFGVSPEQMQAIIEAIGDQIPKFAAIAKEIADQRLEYFEKIILEKFEKRMAEGEANANSFQDPDFQYLIGQAQHAYARSGDADLGDLLGDLIAERSKFPTQSLRSLSLNAAVETTPKLSYLQINQLTYIFILRYLRFSGINSLQGIAGSYSVLLDPLRNSLKSHQTSLLYLQARGCLSISIGSMEFKKPFEAYADALTDGPIDQITKYWSAFAQHQKSWDEGQFKHCTLTATGIAIAHSNLVKLYGMKPDLGIWIPD